MKPRKIIHIRFTSSLLAMHRSPKAELELIAATNRLRFAGSLRSWRFGLEVRYKKLSYSAGFEGSITKWRYDLLGYTQWRYCDVWDVPNHWLGRCHIWQGIHSTEGQHRHQPKHRRMQPWNTLRIGWPTGTDTDDVTSHDVYWTTLQPQRFLHLCLGTMSCLTYHTVHIKIWSVKIRKILPPVWVPHIKQPARLDDNLPPLSHLKELGRPYICDWTVWEVTVIDPCAQDYCGKVSEAANSIIVLVSWNQWNRQLSGFRSWKFAWRMTKFTHHSIDAYRYWFPRIVQLCQHSYTTCFAVSRGLIECSRKLRGFDIKWTRPSPFSRR